jgi:hypothetical protein
MQINRKERGDKGGEKMKRIKIDQIKFSKIVKISERMERRGRIYFRAKEIISKNPEYAPEMALLLLTTWNFAYMSHLFGKKKGTKKFNYNELECSMYQIKPLLNRFKGMNIQSTDPADLKDEIKKLYSILFKDINIKGVGASKVLMLLNDYFFVAWDNDIIKYYNRYQERGNKIYISDDSGEGYFRFLEEMHNLFKSINSANKTVGFAKQIDEYNYKKHGKNGKKNYLKAKKGET